MFEDGFEFLIADVVIDRNKQVGYSAHEFQSELSFLPLKKRLVLVNSVKGEVSIYHTYMDNVLLLFMAYNNEVEYLRWNEYNIKGQVFRDRTYWAQLNQIFKCDGFDNKKIKGVLYEIQTLAKLFVAYNKCNKTHVDKSYKTFTNIKSKYAFYGGLRTVNSKIESPFYVGISEKISSISATIGAEFNLNIGKKDIFVRLSYSTISQNYTSTLVYTDEMLNQSYRTIDISGSLIGLELGYRQYFSLNPFSSLFLSSSVQRIVSNGSFTLTNSFFTALSGSEKEFDLKNTFNINFGLGALIYNNYGVELRYQTRYNITENSLTTAVNVSYLELNIFYRL